MIFLLLLLPLALGAFLLDGSGGGNDGDVEPPSSDTSDTDEPPRAPGDLILSGTDGDDTIGGDTGNDIIYGLGGNDELGGFAGNDTVIGGSGDDRLFGMEGNDLLSGLSGNDVGFAGPGNDSLFGFDGNDLLEGEDGDDFLRGDDGFDYLGGGDGDDRLLGGDETDRMLGNAGDDILRGNAGNDFMIGGDGADFVRGNSGDDILFGGATNFRGYAMGDFNATAQFVAAVRLAIADDPDFQDGLTPTQALDLPAYDDVDQSGFTTAVRDLSADTLIGDSGNDIIHLESNDMATGGTGQDQFWLRGDVPQGVMTITDFDPADDTIYIETEIGQTDPVVTVVDAGSDAEILFDGLLAAEVIGAAGLITASDIDLVAVDRTQPT